MSANFHFPLAGSSCIQISFYNMIFSVHHSFTSIPFNYLFWYKLRTAKINYCIDWFSANSIQTAEEIIVVWQTKRMIPLTLL